MTSRRYFGRCNRDPIRLSSRRVERLAIPTSIPSFIGNPWPHQLLNATIVGWRLGNEVDEFLRVHRRRSVAPTQLLRCFVDGGPYPYVSLFRAFQPLRWLDRFFGRCSRSLILAWWSVGKVRSGA